MSKFKMIGTSVRFTEGREITGRYAIVSQTWLEEETARYPHKKLYKEALKFLLEANK